jgi:hypothetical protein
MVYQSGILLEAGNFRKIYAVYPVFSRAKIIILTFVILTCFATSLTGQQTIKPEIGNSAYFQVINRKLTILTDAGGKKSVHLDARPDDGVAWIKGLNFERGQIEFDLKGKNVPQQSFVGIAFHGVNDSTFEVIYFRPFNFLADDSTRKRHSVQYVFLPKFDWSYLRDRYPGKYEDAIVTTPDPESWFHVRVLADEGKISVFVNKDEQASLVVKPLGTAAAGKIGFWVGNGSAGDFSNLSIRKN